MKRNVLCWFMVACLACAATAAARQEKGKGKAKGKEMTLTGCLKSGDEPNTFMLTNVGGTAGKSAGEYELLPSGGVDLKAHVGHKVEVTGTHLSTAEAMKMEGEAKSGMTKKQAKSEEAREHHLKVTAVKHVSPSCP